MAKDSALIVEPPAVTRTRESSADQELASDMADTVAPDKWVGNAATYPTHKEASLDAQVYKRAVARKMGVEPYKLRTRVWGMRNGKVELDTKAKGAKWQFALRHEPERQKRQRQES